MTVRAVMFDLDGTLLDTLADIARCVNVCLEKMGDPPRTTEEVRGMVGDGVEVLCRYALARSNPERIAGMVGHIKRYYQGRLIWSTRPYDGVEEMLRTLSARGLRLSVLSNRPHAITVRLVEHFFPQTPFEEVMGKKEGNPPKPDPFGALWIAGRMDLSPSHIVYMGDSAVDVQTGKAAGMPTVAVTWGFRDVKTLSKEHPDLLAASCSEILDFVSPRGG